MKKFILFAICFITFCSARAYDFEHNGFYYNILSLSDLTAELTCQGEENAYKNKTASYTGDITVPQTAEFAGKIFNVTQINSCAFINCTIGTLTIPETIEVIYSEDPIGLYGIFSNLVIEDSEKPIRCYRALVRGDVTNSVYLGRNIGGIGDWKESHNIVYWNGGSYQTITFGPKVTIVPDNCCEENGKLTEVNLPSNIKSIGSLAFRMLLS